jgi:hypothetical protein
VTVAAVTVPLTACACTVGTTGHTRTWVVKKKNVIRQNSVNKHRDRFPPIQALLKKDRYSPTDPPFKRSGAQKGWENEEHQKKAHGEAQHRSSASKHCIKALHHSTERHTRSTEKGHRKHREVHALKHKEAHAQRHKEAHAQKHREAQAQKHTHGSTRMEAHAYRGSAQQRREHTSDASTHAPSSLSTSHARQQHTSSTTMIIKRRAQYRSSKSHTHRCTEMHKHRSTSTEAQAS